MIQSKGFKKASSLVLSTILLTSALVPAASAAGTQPVSSQNSATIQKQQENMIDTVEQYIVLNQDGTIGISKDMSQNMIEEYDINSLQERFDLLNQQVKANQIVINEDLSITQKNTMHIMAAKAAKYEKTQRYWWGDKNWYTNAQTKAHIKDLNTAAIAAGGTGAALGALGFIPGAFTGAVAGTYWGVLASRMDANNKGKGVTVSVTWVLAFNVEPR